MTNTPPQLSEKDFIHEGYSQDPYPFWFWMIAVASFVSVLYGGYSWYSNKITTEFKGNPFLQVTNRQMSLFLWQEPEYMRVNAAAKSAYMPAFQYIDKVSVEPPFADDYVIAPPEVIFRYHAWHRLVSAEFPQRPIPVNEFMEFLEYAPEWLPQNWAESPSDYSRIVKELKEQTNLSQTLPFEVRQAFQGWKNFLFEGEAINAFTPSYKEIRRFLDKYPHYARNFWRNIAGTDYLSSFTDTSSRENKFVPQNELPSFLRVALFNFLQGSAD